jgi:glyoxylase-like metal-dependent hydrolase (beta-lactamase superfamily II)
MDRIEIPEEHVVPMDAVAPGVRGLRILFVNVFGVRHADGSWTLIDAALPFTATIIRRWSERNFAVPPRAIVLTHGHFDHVSAAGELAELWNVPIHAHPLERPYLTGLQEYPRPNVGAGGGAMSLLSPAYPRGPVNLGSRLQDLPSEPLGLEVPELPGWRILHTPGHTPGHVSLFREDDRTLLAGDAFCTTKPESFFAAAVTQKPELHGPPAYFTQDWSLARDSVRRLAELEPLTVAPGHGQPLTGPEVPEAMQHLVINFDRLVVPDNRKSAA